MPKSLKGSIQLAEVRFDCGGSERSDAQPGSPTIPEKDSSAQQRQEIRMLVLTMEFVSCSSWRERSHRIYDQWLYILYKPVFPHRI